MSLRKKGKPSPKTHCININPLYLLFISVIGFFKIRFITQIGTRQNLQAEQCDNSAESRAMEIVINCRNSCEITKQLGKTYEAAEIYVANLIQHSLSTCA